MVRAAAGQLPVEKFDLLTQVIPSEQVLAGQVAAPQLPRPSTVAAITQRLNTDSGNIRIEGYQTKSGRVLMVYLPGTGNWSPVGGKSAFDLRSDVELIGDSQNTNSSRAANAALSTYGAKSSDRLILVGYSQGGMVAAQMAEENSNVVGLITIGAPISDAKFSPELPVLSIEHSNDVVPALAGDTNPLTENWATATRHWEIEPGETVLQAHDIRSYAETARLVDGSSDAGLIRIRNKILGTIQGAEPLAVREYEPLKATSKL
jgi:pimeloyl-ACP methyl ester carboxylesterase